MQLLKLVSLFILFIGLSNQEMSSFVENLIKNNQVVVFSKTYCPYSAKAKQTLAKYNLKNLVIIELDKRDDGDEILDYLAKITGKRTVPRVFVNGSFVGGSEKIVEMDQNGQLAELLKNISAF